MGFIISHHAQKEMLRRGISQEVLDDVLHNPQQIIPQREGRNAYQSKVAYCENKIFVVRAIVVNNVEPCVVITVYKSNCSDIKINPVSC